MLETLTTSRESGAYRVGLTLFLLGGMLLLGGIRASGMLIALGWTIVIVVTVITLIRTFNRTVVAGVIGYREGRGNDR